MSYTLSPAGSSFDYGIEWHTCVSIGENKNSVIVQMVVHVAGADALPSSSIFSLQAVIFCKCEDAFLVYSLLGRMASLLDVLSPMLTPRLLVSS